MKFADFTNVDDSVDIERGERFQGIDFPNGIRNLEVHASRLPAERLSARILTFIMNTILHLHFLQPILELTDQILDGWLL